MLRQQQTRLVVNTAGRGRVEITARVGDWVRGTSMRTGLLTIFIRHTSASLLIQENADPQVGDDLERFFSRLAPDGDPLFGHVEEGTDDMPAHVRSALTQTQLSVPVVEGRLTLGTWQGIYVFEHRRRAHARELVLHLVGE